MFHLRVRGHDKALVVGRSVFLVRCFDLSDSLYLKLLFINLTDFRDERGEDLLFFGVPWGLLKYYATKNLLDFSAWNLRLRRMLVEVAPSGWGTFAV